MKGPLPSDCHYRKASTTIVCSDRDGSRLSMVVYARYQLSILPEAKLEELRVVSPTQIYTVQETIASLLAYREFESMMPPKIVSTTIGVK